MSKIELIEKAVLKFNGEWPTDEFAFVDLSKWQEAIIYCIRPDKDASVEPGEIHCGGTGFDPHHYELICTREEFNAAADRMRGKPDWSTLPAKAEWLAQDRCGIWKPMQGRKPTIEEGSYWVTDHHLQPQPRGTVIGDWRNTLEKRPEQKADPLNGYLWGVEYPTDGKRPDLADDVVVWWENTDNDTAATTCGDLNWDWPSHPVTLFKITDQRYEPVDEATESERLGIMPPVKKNEDCKMPAPAKPWFEAGEFPPAGAVCEYKFQNPKYSWQPVTVNYISNLHAILTCHLDGDEVHTDGYTAADFRPIKTDKEKAIEAAITAMQPNALTGTMAIWFGRLYDAGLLRLPDQK